jgi:hypothetical protein
MSANGMPVGCFSERTWTVQPRTSAAARANGATQIRRRSRVDLELSPDIVIVVKGSKGAFLEIKNLLKRNANSFASRRLPCVWPLNPCA